MGLATLAACAGNVHGNVDSGHADVHDALTDRGLVDSSAADSPTVRDVSNADVPGVDVAIADVTVTDSGTGCAPGESLCGATCVDLASSGANCGACGRACGAGESCVASMCVCNAGTTSCSGACVDTANDNANCGACGHACPSPMTCVGGACSGPSCTGAGCLSPGACPAGSTEVTFVSQVVPGPTIAPDVPFDVSVTFTNCGTRTWNAVPADSATGFKLGSSSPRDNTTWGVSRVALPADVPPGTSVQVPIHGQSPAALGFYSWSWGVVNEGVAWLTGTSPVGIIVVDEPPRMVPLCAGVMVTPSTLPDVLTPPGVHAS